MPAPHRIRQVVTLTVVACGLGASGCSDPKEPTATEAGVYTLKTVNGQSIPFTITGTTRGTVVLQGATLELKSGATYSATVTGTAAGGATESLITDAGIYTLTGTTVTFASTSTIGVQFVGALNGNSLSVSLLGLLFGTTGTFVLSLERENNE